MTYTSTQITPATDANAQFWQQLAAPTNPDTAPKAPAKTGKSEFEHPLVLKQSAFWTQAIIWSLVGGASVGIIWANSAELEEAIPAQGKLEPQGAVKDVQAPNTGVVKAIYVKEGQAVKKGDKLLKLDPTAIAAQLQSLQQVRQMLLKENEFYRLQTLGQAPLEIPQRISQNILALAQNRTALRQESQFLRAQLSGDVRGLSADQLARLRFNRTDVETRAMAARLQVNQLQQQLAQAETRFANAQNTLQMNHTILERVAPLAEAGAISQVQFVKQQQEVANNQSEADQLVKEQQRLRLAIQEAQTKVQNTVAVDGKEVSALLATNEQRIAEIDSQFTKAILENNKRIAEIDSQIQQNRQMLKYSDVVAPADGVVFDMKPSAPGYVANATEPLLKIVPQEDLIAKVTISNQDIGFVKPGMEVDIRIDSFPLSEFGDIKGELIWIGSDALPPTQEKPYYSFPAKVKLKQQTIDINGRETKLHAGMSLSVNVKTRKRKVIDVFTEQFKQGAESLKFVR